MVANEWPTVALPAPSAVNTIIGPSLAAVMIELLLLGVVCSQASTYFYHYFTSDGLFIRSIVVSLVISNVFLGITNLYV
jgi:hypothetical protein